MSTTIEKPEYPTLPEYPTREPDPAYLGESKRDWLYGLAALLAWVLAAVAVLWVIAFYKVNVDPSKLTFDNGMGMGFAWVCWQFILGCGLTWLFTWPLRRRDRKVVAAWKAERDRLHTEHTAAVEEWSATRKRLIDEFYAADKAWREATYPRIYKRLGDPAND